MNEIEELQDQLQLNSEILRLARKMTFAPKIAKPIATFRGQISLFATATGPGAASPGLAAELFALGSQVIWAPTPENPQSEIIQMRNSSDAEPGPDPYLAPQMLPQTCIQGDGAHLNQFTPLTWAT